MTTSYTNAHTRTPAPFVGPSRGASGHDWDLDRAVQSGSICTCPLQRSRCAVGYALHHCLIRLNALCHTHTHTHDWQVMIGFQSMMFAATKQTHTHSHTHTAGQIPILSMTGLLNGRVRVWMEWMQTLLEGLFNEGTLQWTEEEDRTQWTQAQESMMEVFEECSRRGDKKRVSAFIRTERI